MARIHVLRSLKYQYLQPYIRPSKNPVNRFMHYILIDIHQIYLPSVGVFAIQDRIPFYVQLTGLYSSLRALRPPNIIRVYLLRQVIIPTTYPGPMHDSRPTYHFVLGEGSLTPVPPSPAVADEENINWEGELKCEENITVGGFNAGALIVQVS